MTEFYEYEELLSGGYLNFCNKVIKPFKETVLQLCASNDEEIEEPEFKLSGEVLEISGGDYKRINKAYQALKKCIIKEATLSAEERKEYITVADAFIDSCQAQKFVVL